MAKKIPSYAKYIVALLILVIIIVIIKNSGPCAGSDNEFEKDQCLAESAISLNEVKDCSKVDNRDLREYCISSIAIESQNLDVCELLINESRGACKTEIAVLQKDISICDTIFIVDNWRDACLSRLSILLNDSTRCVDVAIGSLREKCILELQPTRNDFELCKRLVDEDPRNRCMRDVAVFLDDVEKCRFIQNGLFRDSKCYKKFAQNKNNHSICSLAHYLPIRINCYENVLGIELVDNNKKLINRHYVDEFNLRIDKDLFES
tara:strand:+ start:3467 stop:4255 length:789 start_codon:yes stop_codon:yes gene_type:complete